MRLFHLLFAMCLVAGTASAGFAQADCTDLTPLREDAEKKAAAIKAAAATKKQPVVCAAFKNFATAEAQVVKYLEDHGIECRIRPDELKAVKANHAKTLGIRTKVCDLPAVPARNQINSDEPRCAPQLEGTWVCRGSVRSPGLVGLVERPRSSIIA